MPVQPGSILDHGKYRVLRLLGRGGFGCVYLAEDLLLHEEVAIKELIPGLVGDQFALKRFLAEARATLRLTHPGIVRTFGIWEEAGNYYISMEYMPGGSLAERLAPGASYWPGEAVRIAADVADALTYAHAQGVVHCDLKPANILFGRDGRAKVADFGIAHFGSQDMSRSWATATQGIVGTLAYMSPEQAAGVRDDPRVDIYALGAVLYQMLTGRTYLGFKPGDTPADLADNIILIRTAAPLPPSACSPHVPAWLDAVVLQCLAKHPDARWPTAAALRQALVGPPPAAAVLPQPVGATIPAFGAAATVRTGQTPPAAQAPARRRLPTWALAVAGVVVLLALGATVAALLPGQAAPTPVATVATPQAGAPGVSPSAGPTRVRVTPVGTPATVPAVAHITPTPRRRPNTETPTPQPAVPLPPEGATPAAVAIGGGNAPVALNADAAATAKYLEACSQCHQDTGGQHQAAYDELYQDGVIQVSDVAYEFRANPDTTTISFTLLKNGQPVDPATLDNLSIYWVPYQAGKFQFEPAMNRLSLKGKVTADGRGMVSSTLVELAKDDKNWVDYADVSKTPGQLVIYGRDETLGTLPNTRVAQARYPFAAMLQTGAGVDYASPANVAGCVKCHTDPYLKHGYIYGQVNGDQGTDFYPCKACHLDNGEGGHFEWQLLANDPAKAAEFLTASEEEALKLLSEAETKLYAYNTTLMNDVHMSHAMEFPYPQSMANCVTCHEGKLDQVLADANFTAATCKSCHPVTGAKAEAKEGEEPAYDTTGLSLTTLMGEKHPAIDWTNPADCAICHQAGGVAPTFANMHPGYDQNIYTAEGVRYSDAVSVTIRTGSFNDNKLTVTFEAAAREGFQDVDVTTGITPTVLVSLYGWGTRDFVVGGHERTVDDNQDGKIDAGDQRNLEAEFGAASPNPRLSISPLGGGRWQAVADLSPWAGQIITGTVHRLEVGVLPWTVNLAGVEVAVDATTRTFDLRTNRFDDKAFAPLAETAKCERCHDALATTFHAPRYGGSVTACALCHIVKSGAAHLEMQSRSLDSYLHAVHAMQAFDVATIDFSDPVQALHYEEHTTMPYPAHGLTNCESCHAKGQYAAPSQADALPAVLSASAQNASWGRRIGDVTPVVVGPATSACGSCHRSALINADNAGDLAVLDKHFALGGYVAPAGDKPVDTWQRVTDQVMGLFQ